MIGAPYVLAQLLDFCAFMLAAGVLVCLCWLLPAASSCDADLAAHAGKRLHTLLTASLVALSLTSTFLLWARAAQMGHSRLADAWPVVSIVLFQTHYGMVWFVRATALVTMCGGRVLDQWSARSPRSLCLTLPAVAAFAWTYSASGHAADQGDFSWQEWVHCLHVLFVSLGGGTLAALALVLSRPLLASISRKAWITTIMGRLSSVAWLVVLGVLASGVVSAFSQLTAVHDLWDTAYGRLLLIKLSVVLSMISLGILNRIAVSPSLRAWSGGQSDGGGTRLSDLQQTNAEDMERKHRYLMSSAAALLVLAVLCTLLMASTMPPHSGHP